MNTIYFTNPAFNVPNLSCPNPMYGYPGGQSATAQSMPTASPPTGANPIPPARWLRLAMELTKDCVLQNDE